MGIVTIEEMSQNHSSIDYFYDSIDFHKLNQNKVEKVYGFEIKPYKANFIFGVRENQIKAPYSSPFSMIEGIGKNSIEEIDTYIKALAEFIDENHYSKTIIKLPPYCYDETTIAKVVSSFLRNGFQISEIELNYYFLLESEEQYWNSLYRNAKKNLKQALKQEFELVYCESEEQKKEAYDIIKINRESKGYHLAMSWYDVKNTITYTGHNFFIMKYKEEKIASAIIFQVLKDVFQVVYWGDIPGYSELRPMNFLAYQLYMYYLDKGMRILDIGPSMIDGQPNYGLCSFKESIGCRVSDKMIITR